MTYVSGLRRTTSQGRYQLHSCKYTCNMYLYTCSTSIPCQYKGATWANGGVGISVCRLQTYRLVLQVNDLLRNTRPCSRQTQVDPYANELRYQASGWNVQRNKTNKTNEQHSSITINNAFPTSGIYCKERYS